MEKLTQNILAQSYYIIIILEEYDKCLGGGVYFNYYARLYLLSHNSS